MAQDTVILLQEPDGRIRMYSPYDEVFVAEFKRIIRYDGREWVPRQGGTPGYWLIAAPYMSLALGLIQRWGLPLDDQRGPVPGHPTSHGAGAIAPAPAMPEDLRQAFDCLFLAYRAPLCVAESAFRALSKEWHPDRGGKPEDFHAINDAIDIVRRYLDKEHPRYGQH